MLCLKINSSRVHLTVLLISVCLAGPVITKRLYADEDDLSHYRLPDAISPVNYQLTLLPVIEDKPRLCGHVWINVTVQSPTNVIVLHGQILPVETVVYADSEPTDDNEASRLLVENLCFSGVLATLEQLKDEERKTRDDKDFAQSVHLIDDDEQMVIILKEELVVGAHYRIGILYLAEINDGDNIGFFRVQKKPEDSNNCCPQRWLGATQFEPAHARKVFPSFDEPAFKATIALSVGHDSMLKAISNMPRKSSTVMKAVDDWVWDTFETTPPMSTYLLACVLSELDYMETSYMSMDGRNISLRLWTEKRKFHQLDLAYNLIPQIMETLENYIGIPYSLPKLDMVSLPGYDLARAMENWGLIVQSESTLLQESDKNSTMQKAIFAITIVHELAHQWFGNLVTSSWWSDIWLNEGLATLFEGIVLNQIAPEFGVDVITVLFFQQALFHDNINVSVPLNYPVELLPTIEHKFDGFAYAKASVIFRMVWSFVGDEAFRSGLNRYFNKFQYKTANSTDLWAILTQESRRTSTMSSRKHLNRIMKTWTDQTGYPLVQVDRNPDGTIQLTQTPYSDFSTHPSDNFSETFSWWIPISMTNGGDPKFSLIDRLPVVWLTPKVPSLAIKGPTDDSVWILVNLEYSGYYRVNYDQLGWELLSEQLMRNHTVIPALNRAQLIDDVFTLCHIKILPYEVSLRLIEYLGHAEEESFIRSVAVGHVGRIQQMMEMQQISNDYLTNIVQLMMNYIVPQSTESRGFHSTDVDVRCLTDDQQCVNSVLSLFHDLKNGCETTSVQSGMMKQHFDDVWCTALRHGNNSDWSFAWNRSAASSTKLSEKRQILKAMGCTTDAKRIQQLLSRVFLPNIGQQPIETLTILQSLAENPSARSSVMTFFIKNWAFLSKQNPALMRDLLIVVTGHSSSIVELNKVNSFLEEKSKELGQGITNRIISTISSNIRQVELMKLDLNYQNSVRNFDNDLTKIEEVASQILK